MTCHQLQNNLRTRANNLSLENLKPNYNLALNKTKSKFLNNSLPFKNLDQVSGIEKVSKYKYLSFTLSQKVSEIKNYAKVKSQRIFI